MLWKIPQIVCHVLGKEHVGMHFTGGGGIVTAAPVFASEHDLCRIICNFPGETAPATKIIKTYIIIN